MGPGASLISARSVLPESEHYARGRYLSVVERPGFFASASVGLPPRKLDGGGLDAVALPVFRPPCCSKRPDASQVLDRVSTAGEAKPLMSKGFGKVQRMIAALIRAEPDGAWAYEHLAERIYGTDRFTRAQKNAIGRALAARAAPRHMGGVASQLSK